MIMNLKEKIQQDFREAFKAKERIKSSALRMLISEIKNAEIANKGELDDGAIIQITSKEAKKRRDAMEIYEEQNRAELAEQEKAELEILSSYLPEQLPKSEIKEMVQKAIRQSGATSIKEMGKVMGVLAPQIKGKADGALVSRIVKESLS